MAFPEVGSFEPMDKALVDFSTRLRRAGLTVSLAELLDAGRVLDLAGLADRNTVKDSLRAVLVKRTPDIPVFDAVFDLFFTTTRAPLPKASLDPADQTETITDAIAEALAVYQPDLSLTTELIMTGRFGQLTRLLLGGSTGLGLDRLEVPLQVGYFVRRLRQEMDLDRVQDEANRFIADLRDRGLAPEQARAWAEQVHRNLSRLEGELRAVILRELAQNRYLMVRRLEDEATGERRLANLSDADVLALRPTVDRLARRLKDRLAIKFKHAERGRFDFKTTFRSNVGYGGVWPNLEFKKKKPAKPQVIALCDVSNSVRNFSRFMLLFLYTLKEVISRLRSYVFVGDMVEVTGLFQKREIGEAVGMAAAGHGLKYISRTDYGSVLLQFVTEHLGTVGPKTTVFILGDARNNYYDPHGEALAGIAERARKVIWLNPEPRANWRLGDSVMTTYHPYCTLVAECGNLKQLSQLIEENLIP